MRIFVQRRKELLCRRVVTNLSKLECKGPSAILWVPLLQSVECISNGVEDGVLRLTSWLTICDTDNQNGFLELARCSLWKHNAIDDLLPQRSAHRCETVEFHAVHNLSDLGLGGNIIFKAATGLWIAHINVHEANLDTIGVEK